MISIVMPVYNEEDFLEKSIEKLVAKLSVETPEKQSVPFEILIVSNGSTDKTLQICEALSQKFSQVRYFSIDHKTVGGAFAMGVKNAKNNFIISVDADLSVDLHFIDFATRLLPFCDMVVGSKMLGKQKRSIVRVLGSQVCLIFTQILFKSTLTDYSMAAKGYRRDQILPILDYIDSWTGYVFEICVYLLSRDKKIIQVGVECDDRRKSRFNLFHEGFYRYYHLLRTWRRCKNKSFLVDQSVERHVQ